MTRTKDTALIVAAALVGGATVAFAFPDVSLLRRGVLIIGIVLLAWAANR